MTKLLVGDIGGTKSVFGLAEVDGDAVRLCCLHRYVNREFSGVAALLECFLRETDVLEDETFQEGRSRRFRLACLALAGVVDEREARFTNLDWRVSADNLEKTFDFRRVLLINDLTALAASLPLLAKSSLRTLQHGNVRGDICGVIAPGTGLGEGMFIESGGIRLARGSEGGHTDFAPVSKEQRALLEWMLRDGSRTRVCYEDLIAGPGFGHLLNFCRDYHQLEAQPRITALLEQGTVPAAAVVAGLHGADSEPACPLCHRVISLFLSILGSEAGNLALKLYARGGLYLGGGILPRLEGLVDYDGFIESFCAKDQMTSLMQEIPVHLILDSNAPLLGAAGYGRTHETSLDSPR